MGAADERCALPLSYIMVCMDSQLDHPDTYASVIERK
jgi:hypothetical protein